LSSWTASEASRSGTCESRHQVIGRKRRES
jgi:hypothetical protein